MLGLDYEQIDYKDERTRAVLVELLRSGREQAGFKPGRAKLYIEVYPHQEGGCVIYYTRLSGGLSGPAPYVFAFDDPTTLMRACALVWEKCAARILSSSLYGKGLAYRLVIHPLDTADNLSVSLLSEYGALIGQGEVLLAHIDEHWQLLTAQNALELLGSGEPPQPLAH